jgi:hypothetical protein
MNDSEILAFVTENENSLGMSDFQSRYFVVNSQVTDYRRVRQALIELDNRIGMKKQIDRERKKRQIQRQMILRDIGNEIDVLKKQLLEVDLEQADWDIHMYDKKERMCQNEIDNFVAMIRDLVPNTEDLKKFAEHDELQERNYWITRMAKQASLDINTIGRISQGNMDSILMMPLEDVKETLGLAIKYNLALGKAVDAIGKEAVEQLKLTDSNINYIDAFANEQLKLEANKTPGENL